MPIYGIWKNGSDEQGQLNWELLVSLYFQDDSYPSSFLLAS